MNTWEAVLLGMVQGLTEFLPVSSSGHLVVGQALLGIELPGVGFEVAVHFATLVSVLVVYRRRVGALMYGAVRLDATTWRYLTLIVLANIPAAAVYFLMGDVVEAAFETPAAAGLAFLVTGGVLWSARGALRRAGGGMNGWDRGDPASVPADPSEPDAAMQLELRLPYPTAAGAPGEPRGAFGLSARRDLANLLGPSTKEVPPDPPGPGVAMLIGVAQAFALFPGISRSGSTVVAALWLGVRSDEAAEFSFLMSVPAILGATLLQVLDAGEAVSALGTAPLVFGAVAAAVTGLLAIKIFLAVLRAGSFHRFAPYPWVLGLLFLGYLWIG